MSLNQNVLRLGNEVRDLDKQVKELKRQFAALREAGDEAWYCYRHREPLEEAFQEWATARDGNYQ